MNPKQPIRTLILLGIAFFALIAALIYVGSLANNRFGQIVDSLLEQNERHSPDQGVERVRVLLGESELAVKAYTLTKDESFMVRFYELVYLLVDEFEQFDKDSAYYSASVNTALDTLENVAFRRLNLFERVILTGDEFRVERAMNSVRSAVRDLREGIEATEGSPVATEEAKKKLRLFKRKEQTPAPVQQTAAKDSVLTGFQEDISKLTSAERHREAELRSVTLDLSKDGERVNTQIDSISAAIARIQASQEAWNEARIAILAEKSNQTMRVAVILSIALVVVFAILLYWQVRAAQRYSKAARAASEEALRLAGAKESFVANVSHELRTPLNAIIGFSELLEKEKNPREKENYERIIKGSAHHLGALVNDLLDWSRIEAGKFRLSPVVFDPQLILSEVREMIYFRSDKSDLHFVIRSQVHSPALYGDPLRLKQILINLLSNAFKFTERGEIKLSVVEEVMDEERSVLKIKVQDTGIGIPEDKLEYIFQDFEQLESGYNKKFAGSGLGLAITKKLIEMQSGKISVDSIVGQGTTFFVEIPYEHATRKPVKKSTQINDTKLFDFTILVVDDSTFNRKLLRSILQNTGCDIIEASSGKEALELFNSSIDICLLDIKMPEMDGFELAERIRKLDNTGHVTLIALTAAITPEIEQRCKKAGYNDLMSKPVDQKALLQKLQSTVMEHTGNAAEYTRDFGPALPVNRAGNSPVDLKSLDDIFKGDLAFRNEMLTVFLESTMEEIERLREAIAHRDYEAIDDITHKLAPSCRQLGAAVLSAQIERMKILGQQRAPELEMNKALSAFISEFARVKQTLEAIMA